MAWLRTPISKSMEDLPYDRRIALSQLLRDKRIAQEEAAILSSPPELTEEQTETMREYEAIVRQLQRAFQRRRELLLHTLSGTSWFAQSPR